MTKKPKPVFRILIVEDDPDRAQTLESWLPEDVRTVVVTSAGKAMGLLNWSIRSMSSGRRSWSAGWRRRAFG